MKVNMEQMKANWLELMHSLSVEDVIADEVLDDLVIRYGENGRHYHDFHHVQNVLNVVRNLKEHAEHYEAVQLAAWFHDVIYDMQPNGDLSNEELSARYAGQVLQKLGLDQVMISHVMALIRATQISLTPSEHIDFYILLDADLATLAGDCATYDRYATAIRKEFHFVSQVDYAVGRKNVLQSFLDRDIIFRTQSLRDQLEQSARGNIQREIDSL